MMTSCLSFVLAVNILAAPPVQPPQDALKLIEGTRGGRHWIDEQTPAPKSPAESLKCLHVEPGLKVELVAAEPLVFDPVAIVFDERGKMFVSEYGDYPIGPPSPNAPSLTRIVMLDDTDGNGRMDRRYVFADHVTFAHSLMPFRGGLIVGAQTQILYLKDTDGDHRADVRQVLFDGFTPAHPQMQIGVPKWGMDNWIYWNYGPGKIRWEGPADWLSDGESALPGSVDGVLTMPRKEFRLNPVTLQAGRASGLGQFGNTIDNLGRRFFCTNRNPIITAPIPYRQLSRNPYTIVMRDQYDVGPSGGDTRVYPLTEMKSNYLSHAGTHTSACGTTAYLGDWLGPKYENSVFVCEPVGYLVTRSVIERKGVMLDAIRARPKADFMASTENWFRPASLATGPDGALYVADMYRLWVEHPKFLPDDVAARIDWRAGEDRGRVWRIVPADPHAERPAPFDPPETTADLVRLLTDSNGWRRFLGHRLLVERQATDSAPALRTLLKSHPLRDARLHALWTLDGVGLLHPTDVQTALRDRDVSVRRDAVKLAAPLIEEQRPILDIVLDLANDDDARVRFQVALTLGDSSSERATRALTQIALRDGADPWFTTAILTSCRERSGAVLLGMVGGESPAGQQQAPLVRELASVVGARAELSELEQVLAAIGHHDQKGVWWQAEALTGLAIGLPRYRGALGRMSLQKLLSQPPAPLTQTVVPVRALLKRTAEVAQDATRSIADRVSAIELLGYQSFSQSSAVYDQLLGVEQPVDVQLACITAMQRFGTEAAGEIVLDHWPVLGPQVRKAGLGLLLRRAGTTRQVLETMAAGEINSAVIDIDGRVRLLKHADANIRHLAEKVFGGAISANRRAVAKQYEVALSMHASNVAGKKVFDQVCAKCHVIDGQGHDVGQDISDVRNRSRQALLYDILDPNRKLEPRFADYLIVTVDGRVFNGIMISETAEAVVLKQAEAKQIVIPRNDIDEIQSSGKSLMPEGMEKEVTVQQMADLLEYLKTRRVQSDETAS